MVNRRNWVRVIGPGILVAATGVGAGDLATASLAGAKLGVAVLWAVAVGAVLKFVLTEGLARWQLATGTTVVEGCVERLGRPLLWLFLAYLIVWSFLVGAALMSAIGVTSHAILPWAGTTGAAAQSDKIIYGILHSALAVLLVRLGGYRWFERVMSVSIGVMFVVVVVTAVALRPPVGELLAGLMLPTTLAGDEGWSVALLGGVGGTVTLLAYGYWIREEGRREADELTHCRLDLAAGYAVTAIFGFAMVVVGSSLGSLEGGGATLMVRIAQQLETTFVAAGPLFKWAFLIGAWGAVFSSLLGVWQSVPYLFADLWRLMHGVRSTERGARSGLAPSRKDSASPPLAARPLIESWPYRVGLYGIAVVPIAGLVGVGFEPMQKVYAVVGALFIPMLAAVLLYLNGRDALVGPAHKNSRWTTAMLSGTLVFFLYSGLLQFRSH